jgi:hypothetical protein
MYKRKLTRREVPKIPLISNRTDIPSCLNQKLSLYRQANALIHCSNGDKKFFEQKLPLIRHQLVIPCLNPRHEKALTQIRGHAYGSQFDFVYVGNNNFANCIAVKCKRCAVSTVGGLDRSRRARRGYWRVLLARRRLTGCRRASAAR